MREINTRLQALEKAQGNISRMQESEAQLIILLASKLSAGKEIKLSELKEILSMLNTAIRED